MANSVGFHEPIELISPEAREMHRALTSLQEELEAVDWYRQRADACGDAELKEILLHNMREEMEHAAMILEWLRRHDASMAQQLKTYIGSSGPILAVETAAEGGGASPPAASGRTREGLTVGT